VPKGPRVDQAPTPQAKFCERELKRRSRPDLERLGSILPGYYGGFAWQLNQKECFHHEIIAGPVDKIIAFFGSIIYVRDRFNCISPSSRLGDGV
jgi:hypothetical protein